MSISLIKNQQKHSTVSLRRFWPIVVLFLLTACGQKAVVSKPDIVGTVVGIKDGDTIEILLPEKRTEVIRLADIDCPEKKQAFGQVAKKFTSDLCFGKTVRIVGTKRDRNKRLIARVYVGKQSVNEALIQAGLAWHYVKYSKDAELAAMEKVARRQKIGIWSDPNPVAPWDFRKPKPKVKE